ncbi:antitoxin ParD1/3/4 [Roseinatronobacter thiooxidans]|uniref:Antitoxin ParD1/3/4 n=1 Tax=Roseinatronobacter thiooxidans TaxID=121821 RepID=A0A2W7PL73_9RHOB|nr:type II toxin-antitoxin system ParD family antitoxin [Roseinatronobacter thiooxidans]PZX36928.1 antitoxin ParD1/3/4 [Roseinatronobacter thiooxidans]
MTIKTSISLPETQARYARDLVDPGVFPSLRAVVQHSLEALRQKEEAERADTEALKAVLAARAEGRFLAELQFRTRLDEMLDKATRRYVED